MAKEASIEKKKPSRPVVPLVVSSLTFTAPMWILLVLDATLILQARATWPSFLFLSSGTTTVASVLNWLAPGPGFRATFDRIVARTGALIYTIRGCMVIRGVTLKVASVVWMVMTLGYIGSRRLRRTGNPNWVWSHFTFHVAVSIGTCCVMWAEIPRVRS